MFYFKSNYGLGFGNVYYGPTYWDYLDLLWPKQQTHYSFILYYHSLICSSCLWPVIVYIISMIKGIR